MSVRFNTGPTASNWLRCRHRPTSAITAIRSGPVQIGLKITTEPDSRCAIGLVSRCAWHERIFKRASHPPQLGPDTIQTWKISLTSRRRAPARRSRCSPLDGEAEGEGAAIQLRGRRSGDVADDDIDEHGAVLRGCSNRRISVPASSSPWWMRIFSVDLVNWRSTHASLSRELARGANLGGGGEGQPTSCPCLGSVDRRQQTSRLTCGRPQSAGLGDCDRLISRRSG